MTLRSSPQPLPKNATHVFRYLSEGAGRTRPFEPPHRAPLLSPSNRQRGSGDDRGEKRRRRRRQEGVLSTICIHLPKQKQNEGETAPTDKPASQPASRAEASRRVRVHEMENKKPLCSCAVLDRPKTVEEDALRSCPPRPLSASFSSSLNLAYTQHPRP